MPGQLQWYSLVDTVIRVGPTRSCFFPGNSSDLFFNATGSDESTDFAAPSGTCSDSVINVKLYKDVIVFYAFLTGITLAGVLGEFSVKVVWARSNSRFYEPLPHTGAAIPSCRRFLHRLLFVPRSLRCSQRSSCVLKNTCLALERGVSVGELIMVGGFLGLASYWCARRRAS